MKKKLICALAIAVGLFCFSRIAAGSREDIGQHLLQENKNQIVMLTPPSNHHSGGTGFEVRLPSGGIATVTNGHVCALAESGVLSARIPYEQDRWVNIRVREVADNTDLCILEPIPNATGLRVAGGFDSTAPIWVIGHPLLKPLTVASGYPTERLDLDVMDETPAEQCHDGGRHMKSITTPFGPMEFCVRTVDAWDTSVVIYPGNSGSPTLDQNGEVVGVVFAGDGRDNHGSIIPIDVLVAFLSVF